MNYFDERTTIEKIAKDIQQDFFEKFSKGIEVDIENLEKLYYQKPIYIFIELTRNCNFNCIHCYINSDFEEIKFQDTNKLIDTLNQLVNTEISFVELSGGEPFLHPDFELILEHCLNLFDRVGVLTNGSCITEDFLDKFVPYKNKLYFQIDLHGSRKEYVDEVCGKDGAFEYVSGAIQKITQHNIPLLVVMTLTKNNFDQLTETVKLAKELSSSNDHKFNITKFVFSPMIPVGKGEDYSNVAFNNFSWKQVMERKVYDLNHEFGEFIFKIPEFPKISEESINEDCGAGIKALTLSFNGELNLRCFSYYPFIVLGNIHNDNVLDIFPKRFNSCLGCINCRKCEKLLPLGVGIC